MIELRDIFWLSFVNINPSARLQDPKKIWGNDNGRSISERIHPSRIAGGDRHYRRLGKFVAPRSSSGQRGGAFRAVGGAVHVGTIELKSREHGVQARGPIQPDGSFVLTTYQDGDGAVAGMHDCVLVQFVMTEDIEGHRSSTIGVVDPRYASYATSDLTIEVSATEPNQPIVTVEGLRKKQPENHSHPK